MRPFNNPTGLRLGVLGAVLAAAVTACNPAATAPTYRLRIGVIPIISYLPYYVMREQGFDRQHGLEFEESAFEGGAAVIDAMAHDQIDVGLSGVVPVFDAAQRGLMPDTVVAAAANDFSDAQHPFMAVLAGASVRSWRDLEGQQIGVNARVSLNAAALAARLQQEGVQHYALVEIPLANAGLAVAGGNIAAAVQIEPYVTQSQQRGDGHRLGWIVGSPPFEQLENTLLLFSAQTYRQQPAAARAFLRAQLQSIQWLQANPDAARAILTRRMGLSLQVSQQVHLPRWSGDGRHDRALLTTIQAQLVNSGVLKSPLSVEQLIDETLLADVLANR